MKGEQLPWFSFVDDVFWWGTQKKKHPHNKMYQYMRRHQWIIIKCGCMKRGKSSLIYSLLFCLALFVPLYCSLLLCHIICCDLSVSLSAYIQNTLSAFITVSLSLLVSLYLSLPVSPDCLFFFMSAQSLIYLLFPFSIPLPEGYVKTCRVGGLPAGGQLMRLCPCTN